MEASPSFETACSPTQNDSKTINAGVAIMRRSQLVLIVGAGVFALLFFAFFIIAPNRSSFIETEWARANDLWKQGRKDQAVQIYEATIDSDSWQSESTVFKRIVESNYQRGDLDRVTHFCNLAIEANIKLSLNPKELRKIYEKAQANYFQNEENPKAATPTFQEEKQIAGELAKQQPEASLKQHVEENPRSKPTQDLIIESWRLTVESDLALVSGEVTNNSGEELKSVTAVASFYAADDSFLSTSSGIVEFNPILPGQTSPFKAYDFNVSAIKSAKLSFKHFSGGTISTFDRDAEVQAHGIKRLREKKSNLPEKE